MGIFLKLGVAFVIGCGLYWLISPTEKPRTALQRGRKWLAWVALASTIIYFPKVFALPVNVNALAVWLIVGLFVYGGLAFALGWVYGKFRFRNDPTPTSNLASPNSSHHPSSTAAETQASASADRVLDTGPGKCPNCKTSLLMSSATCPKCGATFGHGSAWNILPP